MRSLKLNGHLLFLEDFRLPDKLDIKPICCFIFDHQTTILVILSINLKCERPIMNSLKSTSPLPSSSKMSMTLLILIIPTKIWFDSPDEGVLLQLRQRHELFNREWAGPVQILFLSSFENIQNFLILEYCCQIQWQHYRIHSLLHLNKLFVFVFCWCWCKKWCWPAFWSACRAGEFRRRQTRRSSSANLTRSPSLQSTASLRGPTGRCILSLTSSFAPFGRSGYEIGGIARSFRD